MILKTVRANLLPKANHKKANLMSHVSALIATYVVSFYYLYLSVTKKALDVFNCNAVEPNDGWTYTTFSSNQCEGGLCRCNEPGGVQQSLVPLAVVGLVLYTLGFPLAVGWTLRSNKYLIKEDQYLRAAGIGDTRGTNPDAYTVRKRFHKLYYHFNPEQTYWIVVIIMRKFSIAFASLMFQGNPTFQLALILLVLFVSFTLQASTPPPLAPSLTRAPLSHARASLSRARPHLDAAALISTRPVYR